MPNGYVVGPRSSYIVPNDFVGNYFAGQDAGFDRAAKQFDVGQKLQTQNALVQMTPEVQNYAQLQAMQMQANQYTDTYMPMLQAAVKEGNYELRDAISDQLVQSGNPMLVRLGEIAKTMKKIDNETYSYDVMFTSPEQRQAAFDADPFLQSTYKTAEAIPLNVVNTITTKGIPGTPNARTHKVEFGKAETPKEKQVRVKNTTVLSVAGIDALLARVPKDSPNREIIAQQLAEAKRKISPTQRVAIEVDDNLVPTGRWEFEGGAAGAGGGNPHFTPLGTVVVNGVTKMLNHNMRTGKIEVTEIPGGEVPGVKGQKHLPAEQADALGKLKGVHENVALVREAWNKTLTGAYEGRVNEALQHIKNDPKFESLRRRTNQLITVAYGLSGKQISAKEIQLLKESILPDVRQMDQNFLTALDELEAWIQRNGDSVQDAFEKSHYDFERVDFGGKRTAAKGGRVATFEEYVNHWKAKFPGKTEADFRKAYQKYVEKQNGK